MNQLRAVIFDVDGTLVDSERDGHRPAFNRAFAELGLPDHWGVERYGELLEIAGGGHRLEAHLRERGLPEAERRRLVPLLHRRKTELFREIVATGQIEPRPGVRRLLEELRDSGVSLAVATTGTRSWVEPLLARLFDGLFSPVITGDEAPVRKPDPSAYELVLERSGVIAGETLAVEDSRNGLRSALAASIPCVVVVNEYTRDHDLEGAALVVDGFGDGTPIRTLSDPHRVRPGDRLDAALFHRLRRRVNGR